MCSGWCNNWVTQQHARCNNQICIVRRVNTAVRRRNSHSGCSILIFTSSTSRRSTQCVWYEFWVTASQRQFFPVSSISTVAKLKSDRNILIQNISVPSSISSLWRNRTPPPSGQGLIITAATLSYSDTWHSVAFLSTSDQSAAETSTWQNTTLTDREIHAPRRDSNPQFLQASGRRPTH